MKHTLPLPTQCSLVTVTIVTEGHARHTATCCCSCICLVSISLKLQCSISCNQRTHETVLVCSGVRSLGHMSVWLSGCLTSSLTRLTISEIWVRLKVSPVQAAGLSADGGYRPHQRGQGDQSSQDQLKQHPGTACKSDV